MTSIRTDRRSRDVDPAIEAKAAAREACRRLAGIEVEAAFALSEIERSQGHLFDHFKSAHAWATAAGFGPQQARRILALGRAFRVAPELAEMVRSGAMCAESAVWIGRLLTEPKLDLAPADRAAWIERAATMPAAQFAEAAAKAIDDARQGKPTWPMRFFVTKDTFAGFHRVRLIMSKGRLRWITEGETLANLVDDWRRRHDPQVAPLPRRGRSKGKRTRYVPRREAALVEARSGGICEICGTARAQHFIHLEPYAEGGGQTATSLAHACFDCHFFVDRGVWTFQGWGDDGRPRWGYDPERLRDAPPPPRDIDAEAGGPPGDPGEGLDEGGDGASHVHERAPPYEVRPRSSGRPRPP